MLLRKPTLARLGLLAVGCLAACLLPSEPSDAELLQFQLNFDGPLRVPVSGQVQPFIHITQHGRVMKDPPAFRLVADDPSVAQVDPTGTVLLGVSRGSTSVRVLVATPIGSRDTVFTVQVVVSSVFLISQDPPSGLGNYVTLTRLGQTHQFRAITLDARAAEIPNVPVTWSTKDSLIAKFTSPGLLLAVGEGYTQMLAEVDGIQGLGSVAVVQSAAAVRLAPQSDTLRTLGRSTNYLALALDSSNQVIDGAKPRWSSTDTNVARVSPLGVATATGPGTARIIARVGTAADTATLVVAQVARYVFISPAFHKITALADTARFTADVRDSSGSRIPNPDLAWAVRDTSIATIDRSGLVTARKSGADTVTAAVDGQGAVAVVSVWQQLAGVRVLEDSIALTGEGSTAALHVEGLDRNGYVIPNTSPGALSWGNRLALVASTDAAGVVTAHQDGTTWIDAWVPMGGRDSAIVSVSGAPHELIAFTSGPWDGKVIEVVRADGTNRSVLITGADGPAWSTDGSRVAFERLYDCYDSCYQDIYAARADGSDTVALSDHQSYNSQPAWSPDGSRIAFHTDRAPQSGIFIMNADGSNATLLRGDSADSDGYGWFSADHPTWSPDGTRLAFDQACNVNVINAEGSGILTLTASVGGCSSAPAWSPDGSQLAFVNYRDGLTDIWLINPDGTGATNLTKAFTATTPSDGSPPAWSPLGSQIVFAAAAMTTCEDYYYGTYPCPGRPHLWVVSRDGSAITQITNGDGESRPSWRRAAPIEAAASSARARP